MPTNRIVCIDIIKSVVTQFFRYVFKLRYVNGCSYHGNTWGPFTVVTICGANSSLLWCFCTAPGSQRSPVNQWGCYSDVSCFGFSMLRMFFSLQLALFSCYSLFRTNGKQKTLHCTYTAELFTDLWNLPDSFLQDGSCLNYTVWFLSIRRLIHFLLWWLCSPAYLKWNNDYVVSALIWVCLHTT